MKYKILKSKKAGAPIDEMTALILFLIFATFLLIFINFTSVTKENRIDSNIEENKIIANANSDLLLFLEQLRKESKVSEIIVHSFYSQDYSELISIIREFFNAKYRNDWILTIEDSNNNVLISANPNSFLVRAMISVSTTRKEVATAYVPLIPTSTQNYLKIRIFLINFNPLVGV